MNKYFWWWSLIYEKNIIIFYKRRERLISGNIIGYLLCHAKKDVENVKNKLGQQKK